MLKPSASIFLSASRVLRIRATQRWIAAQPVVSHPARPLDRAKVSNQMDKTKRQCSDLSRSQQISRPAQLQVGLGDSGSGSALAHELKACESRLFRIARCHEAASRGLFAPPHSTAQLMQLRKPIALRRIHHDHSRLRHVDSNFHHRRADQQVDCAVTELAHRAILFRRAHSAVHRADSRSTQGTFRETRRSRRY